VAGAQARYEEKPAEWRNAFNLALYHLAAGDRASAARLYEESASGGPPVPIVREAIDDLDEFLDLFPQNEDGQGMREMLQTQLDQSRYK
jgi:hypothetical protein